MISDKLIIFLFLIYLKSQEELQSHKIQTPS